MRRWLAALLLIGLSAAAASPRLSPFLTDHPKAYSQSLQLERGWNLVSWYIWPEDPTPLTLLRMDDLFDQELQPPGGPDDWFWSEESDNPTDKVGRFDKRPTAWQGQPPQFYPQFGKNNMNPPWDWNLRQAYTIYLDTGAHFWEFTSRPLYAGETPPQDDFTPNSAWDDYTQAGIPQTDETYWFFMSYPQRMDLRLNESATIYWLAHYTSNPLQYLKDDAGHFYDAQDPNHSNLEYLQPGKGYFLGYCTAHPVQDCPWFFNEVEVPAGMPSEPKENQASLSSVPHFQFKSRTHWWYPINIDTIAVDSLTPVAGDEIGVFCGDQCVGATAFEEQYPIYLAAWMDDIATPDSLDGYLVAQEMIFKWFDISTNQEITFVPPPETQGAEIDPYNPSHSGFGQGFCSRRSLINGIQSVYQLPQDYRLGQNFPNPFNAVTTIPLELPQRSHLKIELFNVRGQNLGVIFEGIENAGWPKIRYNASNLTSGIYFLRLTAEGLERGGKYQNTGKMLLLK